MLSFLKPLLKSVILTFCSFKLWTSDAEQISHRWLSPAVSQSILTDHLTVNTPGGPRPQSYVHFVPPGARVQHSSNTVQIISEHGVVLNSVALNIPGILSNRLESTSASLRFSNNQPIETGYVAYTYWTENSDRTPISNFSSSWVVPATPQTDHDQVLYLFSALTPSSRNSILQPVLQYGTSAAGGGSYWAIASWYLVGSHIYHSTLVPVQSGQTITGILSLSDSTSTSSQTTSTYNSRFIHSPYSTLTVNTAEILNLPWEVLEIYSVESKSDLPLGKTTFENITLFNSDGKTPPLAWSTRNNTRDGLHAIVVVDGPIRGVVDIVYS